MTIPVHEGTLLSGALEDLRFEVVPVPAIASDIGALTTGSTVTITSSPKMGIERTVAATEELAALGYNVVPHLAARQIQDREHLTSIVARLVSSGVEDVMVLAGDAASPAGTYSSSLEMLRDLEYLGNPFARIGVGGYPEGHPAISTEGLRQALRGKAPHATYIVSQLCFSAESVQTWVETLRWDGVDLPVYIGVPGKVSHKRLLTMATRVGVGDSLSFLKRNAGNVWRMMFTSEFDPEELLRDFEQLLGPEYGVSGFHMYTFNAIAETEAWRKDFLRNMRD